MKYFFIGLGNPGEEYENTRHNAGRTALMRFADAVSLGPFEKASHSKGLYTSGAHAKTPFQLFLPESFMNNSGKEVSKELSGLKKRPEIVVVYDDMDLPLGSIKISFGRSSGGHNGLESVIKALKTKDFTRIRVGIAPVKSGKARKPVGEKQVIAFLMKPFTPLEQKVFSKIMKKVGEAMRVIIEEGHERAMNRFNS